MSGERPQDWQSWLLLAEWWYNSIFHLDIQITPYEALYDQAPSHHMPYLAGASLVAVDRSLQQREAVRKLLQFHLKELRTE